MRNLTNVFPYPSLNINSFMGQRYPVSTLSKSKDSETQFWNSSFILLVYIIDVISASFYCVLIHSFASLSHTRSNSYYNLGSEWVPERVTWADCKIENDLAISLAWLVLLENCHCHIVISLCLFVFWAGVSFSARHNASFKRLHSCWRRSDSVSGCVEQRLTADLFEVSSELARVVSNQPILFG